MNLTLKSYLFCFITIVFFSTYEVAGKLIGGEFSAYFITYVRFFIGGLIILPLAIQQYKKNPFRIHLNEIHRFILPGFLNVTLSMVFLQLSVHFGKAALTALIVSSNPLFVALFGVIILKERVSLWRTLGLVIGFLGMFFVVFGEKGLLTEDKNMLLGIIFAISAAVTFALYTVVTKLYLKNYPIFVFNSISFIAGSLILLFFSSLFMKNSFPSEIQFSSSIILLYLGIFVTGFAYLLYFEGLKNIPVATGSMFFYLKPFIASVLAFFILGERLFFIQIIGFLVIIIGINFETIVKIKSFKKQKFI
ncbi:MAG: DMT family transporter [Candidatus Cloacimonetes bacterium]|nr:DMT family transporter [Candidatus Cloacimonadota bacterium]